jgi:hypothetical protein
MRDEEPRQRNAPIWLKILLFAHVLAITIWALPNPAQSLIDGNREPVGTQRLLVWNHRYLKSLTPVSGYLFTTGAWQYWDMFAPDPAQTDIWCDADVVYRDGTVKRYAYPRIYDLPLPEKYLKERYRKFYERVNQDQYNYLWPVFAQRIAFEMDDPQNPPVEVRLRRHWLTIVKPGEQQPTEYNTYHYYTHAVDPVVLQRARDLY